MNLFVRQAACIVNAVGKSWTFNAAVESGLVEACSTALSTAQTVRECENHMEAKEPQHAQLQPLQLAWDCSHEGYGL